MKIIFNKGLLEINQVFRVSQNINQYFEKQLEIIIPFSQDDYENLLNFFKNNSINDIQIYKNDIYYIHYTNFTVFKSLDHNISDIDKIIKITLMEKENE